MANQGPVYLDGARDVPEPPPAQESPTRVFDPPFCGYRLTADDMAYRHRSDDTDAVSWVSATVAERLQAHGVTVEPIGAGMVQVPLAQRLRALLPYMLDPELETSTRPEGIPNLSMVVATRLDDRRPNVHINGADTGVSNRVTTQGCSINDLIADEVSWPDPGQFAAHVNQVLDTMTAQTLLDDDERAAIIAAAISL